MMYVRSASKRPASTRMLRLARATVEAPVARSATPAVAWRAASFAADALDATGAANAATVVLRAFTGARAEATTRVAEAETAKDIVTCGCARGSGRGMAERLRLATDVARKKAPRLW